MTQVNLYNNAYGLDMVGEMLNNLQRRLYTMKDVRLASMRLRGIKFGSHQRQLHYYVEFRCRNILLIMPQYKFNFRYLPNMLPLVDGQDQQRLIGRT